MRILVATAAVGLAITLAGCATVTRGTTSQVQIQSDPPGALAHTSTGFSCTTPCTITIPRKDEFSVVFSKPGYQEETCGREDASRRRRRVCREYPARRDHRHGRRCRHGRHPGARSQPGERDPRPDLAAPGGEAQPGAAGRNAEQLIQPPRQA